MGRPNEGWRILWRGKGKVFAYVRFTHDGQRHEISLGRSTPGEAARRGAAEYVRVVQGAVADQKAPRGLPDEGLSLLLSRWLREGLAGTHETGPRSTQTTYGVYAGHFSAHFGATLAGMTPAKISGYARARLARVTRTTVQKELGALRGFVGWLVEQEVLPEPLVIPPIPGKQPGTRTANARKPHGMAVPADLVERWLAELPERTPAPRRGAAKGCPLPCRAYHRVLWETGLRPTTIEQLTVPENWKPGADTLRILDHQDKEGWGRAVPLSPAAVAALESVGVHKGLLFGPHDYRAHVPRSAAKAGWPEELAEAFAPYDLRHSRITHWLARGVPVVTVAFLVGHRDLTTTSRYAHGSLELAREALGKLAKGTDGVG